MRIGRNSLRRRLAAACIAVAGVVAPLASSPASGRGSAIVERFIPDSGGFTVFASALPAVHPGGEFGFVLAGNRLLCTFELATGAYVSSLDLGLEMFAALEAQPVAPMTLSANGRVLALVAAGSARFYDVSSEGVVTERSSVSNVLSVAVRMNDDGRLAVVALDTDTVEIATIDTTTGAAFDVLHLVAGEAPIEIRYDPDRRVAGVLTTTGLVFLRHKSNGNLTESGRYTRTGFSGDAFSQFSTLGKRGRVAFTVDAGGAALIGLSLKGKDRKSVV